MKNVMIGILSTIILILSIMIGMTIYGRNARTLELENAVNSAQKYALGMLGGNRDEALQSNEELVTAFEMSLFSQIESKFVNVDVKIIDVDYEKGLIEAEVTEYYKHVNGRTGSVKARKMNFLEKAYREDIEITYQTDFYDGRGDLYWSYKLTEGNNYQVPEVPDIEGKTFVGWAEYNLESGTYGAVIEGDKLKLQTITDAKSYIAVYEDIIDEEDEEEE